MRCVKSCGGVFLALGLFLVLVDFDALGSISVVRGVIARDVSGTGGCANNPVSNKNYTSQDPRAGLWVDTDGFYNGETVESQFYDPQGNHYGTYTHHDFEMGHEVLNACAWIDIAGTPAAERPGQWTAKFVVNGTVLFQDTFTITLVSQGSAPQVTYVNAPSGGAPIGVPTYFGTDFSDQDGDVNWARFEILTSSGWALWGEFDPGVMGMTQGTFQRDFTCTGSARQWDARVTLYDAAGHSSNAYQFSFDCVAAASSLHVVQHLIARSVVESPCCSANQQTTFSPQDQRAFSYVELGGSRNNQALRFEFYDPQGHLYTSQEAQAQYQYHWAWVDIAGNPAANLPGQWAVKFYIDGQFQFEDHFTITGSTGNACGYTLGGGIYDKWIELGGEHGLLGCPTRDEGEAAHSPQGTEGRWSEFGSGDGGYIIWHRTGEFAGQAFEVHGCMFKLYKSLGGTGSWLGFPVSDEYDVPGGRRSDFEGGYITWDPQTYECHAYSYDTNPPPPPSTCSWAGNWVLDGMNGTFTQTGNQVTGSFSDGFLTLRGTVSGNKLTGTWSNQEGGSETFELTISSDCNSLTGRYSDSTGTFDITGTRAGATPPAGNPWDTPVGQGCFERWIAEAMGKLNSYNGTKSFNDNKPYSINKYGILEGKNFHSVAAPDNFRDYNFNKYWYMWDYWNSWSSIGGWPDPNWDAAGVPPLRPFVLQCIEDQGGSQPPPPPPPPPGNPWDTPAGQGGFEQWIAEAMGKLNRYNGTKSFNDNKPYSINKYGILEGKNFHSVAAPDNFRDYNFNKYWYMWDFWNTWGIIGGWPDPNWDAAGVPPLRGFVNECLAKQGGTGLFAIALDDDSDGVLGDSEIKRAVQYWILGDLVEGAGSVIDDPTIRELIQMWILGESVDVASAAGAHALAQSSALEVQAVQLGAPSLFERTLRVQGQGIAEIMLHVFDLSGRLVLAEQSSGSTLRFSLLNQQGQLLANGLYLYVVSVQGLNGERWQSAVRKLLVLK